MGLLVLPWCSRRGKAVPGGPHGEVATCPWDAVGGFPRAQPPLGVQAEGWLLSC